MAYNPEFTVVGAPSCLAKQSIKFETGRTASLALSETITKPPYLFSEDFIKLDAAQWMDSQCMVALVKVQGNRDCKGPFLAFLPDLSSTYMFPITLLDAKLSCSIIFRVQMLPLGKPNKLFPKKLQS